MKIGEFARKYDLNVRTVRYYVDRALLNPQRRNNQYVFDEKCCEDMEQLLRYKRYHLTLQEIELMRFLEKASNLQDATVIQIIGQLLADKKSQLEREREELSGIIGELQKEIGRYEAMEVSPSEGGREGVPVSFLPYLCCPDCGQPLALENAAIHSGGITGGDLQCTCGYQASIEEGMILCEGWSETTPFHVFNNEESVLSIMDEYSDNYRQLVDKAYTWMYHQLGRERDAALTMAGPFTANFLLTYGDRLKKEGLLLVTDVSRRRLENLRRLLAGSRIGLVCMAGAPDRLPLRRHSVELYLDDFSTINHIFTYGETLCPWLDRLLSPDGRIVGIWNDYAGAPASMQAVMKLQPGFDPERMAPGRIRAAYSMNGLKLRRTAALGETAGPDRHFPGNTSSEQCGLIGYIAGR